jgi:hypothetical protein
MRLLLLLTISVLAGCYQAAADKPPNFYRECLDKGAAEGSENHATCIAVMRRSWELEHRLITPYAPDGSLLPPYSDDAYGPGTGADATGREYQWETQDGEKIAPFVDVISDAYGPGIGMDQYGRPVRRVPQ